MSSDGEEEMCTPPEISEKAKIATDDLLPVKSRERYEIVYQRFMDWKVRNKIQSLSENVMLAYFGDLSKEMKPSSLWAIYSMLKATINIRNNTNIANYPKLLALLKRKSDGFRSKKSKTLTADEINQFLKNAPDSKHLLSKVILIFGISGACRKQELRNITTGHVEDTGKSLIIKIPDSKTKTQRSFIVPEAWYPTCKKYINLRPSGADEKCLPFFLNYQHEKCTKQSVGINKFGSVPTKIAEFLGLPNPKDYTGHCFRRSSATILVDAGGDLLALKRHGGWRSSAVAEGYVDNSTKNKTENALKISSAICDGGATSNDTIVRDLNMASSSGTNVFHHNTLAESSTTSIFNNSMSMAPSNAAPVFHNCTTHQQRPGTAGSAGTEYEYLIPALFALRAACSSHVADMWLATNADGMGAFDDVLFFLEYENGQKEIYIMQLKHKAATITAASFAGESNDYSVSKYQNSYEKILKDVDGNYSNILENITLDEMIFLIYTTANLTESIDRNIMNSLNLELHEKQFQEDRCLLLNTCNNQESYIYQFKKADENKLGFDDTFLSKFFIFTKQGKIDSIEDSIQKLFGEEFNNPNKSIVLNFLNFMKIWERGGTGTQYVLRKKDVQLKLTELLLDAYLVEPKVFLKFRNASLWNDIVQSAEITTVKNCNEEIISMIWTAINIILYKHCNQKIKQNTSWESPNEEAFDNLPRKYKNLQLETTFLEQIDKNKKFTMKYLSIMLWKAGLLPLIFKADSIRSIQHIETALTLSKDKIINRHCILLFTSEIEDLKPRFKDYTIIETLSDVVDKRLTNKLLENMEISLQEKKPISLLKLVEDEENILKEITTTMVLEMLHKPLILARKYDDLPKPYIRRNVRKLLLYMRILKLTQCLFVINGPKDIFTILKTHVGSQRVVEKETFLKEGQTETDKFRSNVVALEEGDTLELNEIQRFTKKYNAVHHLRYYRRKLEWISTVGCINDIRPYIINVDTTGNATMVREELLPRYFTGYVNIISADSGMGKSVIIKRIAQKCREDYWVIMINLNNHENYFKEINTHSLNYFIDCYLKNNLYTKEENFVKVLVAVLLKKKKLLFLLDAFDELPTEITKTVVSFVKFISNRGLRLWITTRPNHSAFLEQEFNTFSLSLTSVTENEQKAFLSNYFTKLQRRKVDNFIEHLQSLMSKSFKAWSLKFLSVPLHLHMIAEVMEDINIKDFEQSEDINAINLYEMFLNKKFEVYLQKKLKDCSISNSNRIYLRELKHFRSMHDKSALLLFYPRKLLEDIFEFKDVDEFLTDTINGEENFGVVLSVTNTEGLPIFVHQSFAEYLAAKFLSVNFQDQKYKSLIEGLFQKKRKVVRLLFDRILAKDRPLHLAVLNNDFSKVKEYLGKRDELSEFDYDLGRRTPLHLAASWGPCHDFPRNDIPYGGRSSIAKVSLRTADHLRSNDFQTKEIFEILYTVKEFCNKLDLLLGWDPKDYAIRSYSINLLDIFVKDNEYIEFAAHFDINSLLYYCVKFGYVNILRTLSLNTYINLCETKKNLLHVAVENFDRASGILPIFLEKCNKEILKIYLEKGAGSRSGELGPPIMFAAQIKNNMAFKTLLHYEYNLNKTSVSGLTVLHILVFFNNLEGLKELITRRDVDINVRAKSVASKDYAFKSLGHTALYFAVNNNYLEIVEFLILSGADIHLTYENKRTVLHVAAINEYIDCIKVLNENGSDLHSLDENCRTPLHYAALNAKLNSVNYLLNLGASLYRTDVFGRTPLHYMLQNFKIGQIVFPNEFQFDLHERDFNDKTLLHLIFQPQEANVKRIKYLLKLKNLNNWHHYEITPQDVDILRAKLSNVQFLVQLGAYLDAEDNDGRTILHYVTIRNSLEGISYILSLGADINKQDKNGETPLFKAIKFSKLATIEFLLKSNPDVNKCTIFNVSPLHLAIHKGFTEYAGALIDAGANVNLSSTDGCTPLLFAIRKGNEKLVKLLMEHEAKVNTFSHDTFIIKDTPNCIARRMVENKGSLLVPLHVAVLNGNLMVLTYILNSRKIRINQTDNNGWTALHLAADRGFANCIQVLLDKGSGLYLQTKGGSTPIHLATKNNHHKTLEALLKTSKCTKALNKLDNYMQTALHIASYFGYLDCVKVLVGKGADLSICTKEGYTALDLAVNQNHDQITQILQSSLNCLQNE